MHDYVIVGAGSAGCVLAARLSEDPGTRVILLEAGGSDRDLRVRAPALMQLLWRSKLDWSYATEPQAHADGRKMFWPRGKVLGGSGSINAMLYVRGHRADYDGWAAEGNAGWGWNDVLPYFVRSERNSRGASPHHGIDGPLRVSDAEEIAEVSDAFVEAACRLTGAPRTDDFNRGDSEGFGRFQVNAWRGERWSTARAFVEPARRRANLTVRTGVLVTGLALEGGRARGVRCRIGGREHRFDARREVILCAGAIGSPQILLLSGIGPRDHLRRVGIPVLHELSGVGRNLQDHLMAGCNYEVTTRGALAPGVGALAAWTAQWLATRRGPLAVPPIEAGGFLRTRPDATHPDLQLHFFPWGGPEPNSDEARPPPEGRQATILPSLIYPKSRGTIRLKSPDPAQPPAIDPAYLSHEDDLRLLVDGLKLSREIAASAPLRQHLGRERLPGAAETSDDALVAHVRRSVNTIFHPVGTCAMGTGEDAVVDARLRVHGVEALRVVDASVMPRITGGNTHAPTVMIAEKAADLIRAR